MADESFVYAIKITAYTEQFIFPNVLSLYGLDVDMVLQHMIRE